MQLLKFLGKFKGPRVKNFFTKKKFGEFILSTSCYRQNVKDRTMTVWYTYQIEKWNVIGCTETDLHIYSHLIFNKGIKANQWKIIIFQ